MCNVRPEAIVAALPVLTRDFRVAVITDGQCARCRLRNRDLLTIDR